jgi:hypothetical protein
MQYTLVITASGRTDLLRKTWETFQACRDIQQTDTIIIEDGDTPRPDWLPASVKYIANGTRRGQIFSIDKAYDLVRTPYIFHCEEDWWFRHKGFLQESLDILEKYPDIFQVWLRGIPTERQRRLSAWIYTVEPHPTYPDIKIANYHWDGWQSFSFNPGLRRLSDYHRIGNYGRHVGYDPQGCGERALGILYNSLGYKAAILEKEYVLHTGDEVHIDRKANPPAKKILVAIPTADELDYEMFREMQLRKWGRVWQLGVSGLQKDGPNERKKACEETWAQDVKNFSNVSCKLFTSEEFNSHVLMPHKMRWICAQMVEQGFDLMFRPDDDTAVDVARMVRQGLELTADYAGEVQGGFVIGGPGIYMTHKACSVIANSECPDYRVEWRDDAWIGQVLLEAGIKPTQLHMTEMEEGIVLGPLITRHPVSPEKMREYYHQNNGPLS